MENKIVWEYESSGKSTTDLFYMLVGGYPFAEALVELATFVADPRIPIYADAEGHAELETQCRVFVECPECNFTLSSSASKFKFSVDAPLQEDFVGQQDNPGFTICHHRVRDQLHTHHLCLWKFADPKRSLDLRAQIFLPTIFLPAGFSCFSFSARCCASIPFRYDKTRIGECRAICGSDYCRLVFPP